MRSAISPNWIVRKSAVRSAGGLVAAQNSRAAAVGADILRAGGNAVDAAVATSFALAATEPWMSGLGGGGYMLIWLAAEKKFHAIEFGMIAPSALDPADYPLGGTPQIDIGFGWPGVVEDRNLLGPLSIAVPGQVDGVGLALETFGTRRLPEVLAGAIELADEGLSIDWYTTLLIALGAGGLARFPSSKAVWLPNGLPPGPNWEGPIKRLPLGRLAETLRAIAADGRRTFYDGPVADLIVADMQALGAKFTRDDLAQYRARPITPVTTAHGGSTIATVSGLTAGPSLIRCLEELGSLRLSSAPDAATYLAYTDILQRVYRDRLDTMGHGEKTSPSCTTHLSVIDRAGNMVSLTQTLVSLFGSKVVLPRTGILMNNSIMTFDPRPGRSNSIVPGRRPLANMCPLIALRDGRPHFSLGAAGGRRILPALFQITDFLARLDMPLDTALEQPRIDSSGTDLVNVDPRLPEPIRAALATRFQTSEAPRMVYPLTYATATGVWQGPDGARLGTSEPMQPWADAVSDDG